MRASARFIAGWNGGESNSAMSYEALSTYIREENGVFLQVCCAVGTRCWKPGMCGRIDRKYRRFTSSSVSYSSCYYYYNSYCYCQCQCRTEHETERAGTHAHTNCDSHTCHVFPPLCQWVGENWMPARLTSTLLTGPPVTCEYDNFMWLPPQLCTVYRCFTSPIPLPCRFHLTDCLLPRFP